MGNRIKIGLEIRIHDKDIALTKQGIDSPQCILAAAAPTKPVAVESKVLFKYRFQNMRNAA